jgi:hypothetical protein
MTRAFRPPNSQTYSRKQEFVRKKMLRAIRVFDFIFRTSSIATPAPSKARVDTTLHKHALLLKDLSDGTLEAKSSMDVTTVLP